MKKVLALALALMMFLMAIPVVAEEAPLYTEENILIDAGDHQIPATVKKYNIPLLFHSCGSVEQFIPDLIEIGVNGLCVVQTSANNMKLADLAEKYRNQIVFWGAVDAQQVLPRFTAEEVEAEVHRNMALFPSGGYVVANSHHSMPDIKGENIEAMCRAVTG